MATLNANRFSTNSLVGTFVVSNSGYANLNLTTVPFALEDDLNFVINIRTNSPTGEIIQKIPIRVIDNTSVVSVTANTSSVVEGSNVLFTITTANITGTQTIYYSAIGPNIDTTDFFGGNTGPIVINNNNAVFELKANADLSTPDELGEFFNVQIRGGNTVGPVRYTTTGNITILDTSNGILATSIVESTNSFIEGANVTFTITTFKGVPGTVTYYYSTTGNADSTHFVGGNTGSFTITGNNRTPVTTNLTVQTNTTVYSHETRTFQLQLRENSTTGKIFGTSNVITISDSFFGPTLNAIGGDEKTTNTSTGVTTHVFLSSNAFTVTEGSGTINYLIVAGGGGGGALNSGYYDRASGGGAGGYLTGNILSSAASGNITIGAGGAGEQGGGGGSGSTPGARGSNTLFAGNIAVGGGVPSLYNGGSGAGGGGLGYPGQGNPGYIPTVGGGGGAGAAGGQYAGGIGLNFDAPPSYGQDGPAPGRYFAGGGSRGQPTSPTAGGIGGGGVGYVTYGPTSVNRAGQPGNVNMGGGGGGGATNGPFGANEGAPGGTGGSGIVILKYSPGRAEYRSLTSNTTTVTEGGNVTFTLSTTNVSNNTLLYYQTSGNATSSNFITANIGTFRTTNDTTNITLQTNNNVLSNQTRNFVLQIKEDPGTWIAATSNNIIIRDQLLQTFNISAIGGNTSTSGGYNYVTFTTSNTLTVVNQASTTFDYFVVGGGGGSQIYYYTAGGGAGGVLAGNAVLSGTYNVIVGAGGGGGPAPATTPGANSVIQSTPGLSNLYVAIGGGSGGGSVAGGAGGSGGGGSGAPPYTPIGLAIGSPAYGVAGTQGYPGGPGLNMAGGGGGAGEAGYPGAFPWVASTAKGGNGRSFGGVTYAGGGGGAPWNEVNGRKGLGGDGGGGNSGTWQNPGGDVSPQAGNVNTGGGAGGSSHNASSAPQNGSAGGSGIVIIRYPSSAGAAGISIASSSTYSPGANIVFSLTSVGVTDTFYYETTIPSSNFATANIGTVSLVAGQTTNVTLRPNANTLQPFALQVRGDSNTGAIVSSTSNITPIPTITYLLVAGGGGGGGAYYAGGGGAGGYLSGSFTATAGVPYSFTIGAAGAGGPSNTRGTNGGNSTLISPAISTLTAVGGGGGGTNNGSLMNGLNGGSGGGAANPSGGSGPANTGGTGYPGQGNSGGIANSGIPAPTRQSGGGGGGAGTAGKTGVLQGFGGDGLAWINGNYYAGGGGGGQDYNYANLSPAPGGLGGGGSGAGERPPGTPFLATAGNVNTGGGGGAGAHPAGGANDGKAGGSGIGIFAHPTSFSATSNYTNANVVTTGGNVYYIFTGPGTITF